MSRILSRADIERILPHRDPFLFVEEVLELVPAKRVVGIVRAPETGLLLQGMPNRERHFPATLLIEAMAQVGAILVLYTEENRGRTIYFRAIERARFHRTAPLGRPIRVEGDVRRMRSRMGTLEMRALLDDAAGAPLAEGVMSFAL